MALNAYLKLKGQKQGEIKGSVIQKGRENMIAVHAISHSVQSPRDPASGLATGKRQHQPLRITKQVDRSSPQLLTALAMNENIVSFELRCFEPNRGAAAGAGGAEKNHYTIVLTNASVIGVRMIMENNTQPDLANLPLLEEITFAYQKIQWTYTDGGITAMDDWQSPVV